MQIRSLSLKLLTTFSSIKLFQFLVTIETWLRLIVWETRIWVKSPGFRFGSRTRNAKRISPSPPEKAFPKSWLYGFPLYRSSWKNCSREQCFFSACYACACETNTLSKTVQIFSRIPEILITKGQISLV